MALTVGQKVIVKVKEWRQPVKYIEATVSKVGRMYFELESVEHSWIHRTKFYIEDLHGVTDYGSHYEVYLSTADVIDELMTKKFTSLILNKLGYSGYHNIKSVLSVALLQQLVAVIEPDIRKVEQYISPMPIVPGGREYLLEQYGINTKDSQETVPTGQTQ